MIIKTANRLGTVKEYYFSKKLREIREMVAAGKPVLNLGIGSPDLPPAPSVIETLNRESLNVDNHGYQSYVGLPELRNAFSNWYKKWFQVSLNPNGEILPLIGSKEGIMHISMTFLEQGDEVLVPNPGYPAYAAVAQLTGATIRTYNLTAETSWLPDLEELEATDLSKVKIMWVNYPNMPTGKSASYELFEKLVALGKKHRILICNDNPYAFILNEQPVSILSVPGAKEVALELNSLSKAHNMAGWRLGMLGGTKAYLDQVLRFKSNMDSGMFKPLQLAAVKALEQPMDWYQKLNEQYKTRRVIVAQLFDLLNCTYDAEQVGLFVWAKIPNRYDSAFELSNEILEQVYVFLTPGGIFGSEGDRYLRISLCSPTKVFEEAKRRIEKYQIAKVK